MHRPLPGLSAPYIHICLTQGEHDYWEVHVQACDGPGFVSAGGGDRYEGCTRQEADDVVAMALSTLLGLSWS